MAGQETCPTNEAGGFPMNITGQEIATAVILMFAVCYVARRVVRFFRRKGMPDCHSCPNCRTQTDKMPLVVIKKQGKEDGDKRQ